jgi:hypothetical protein
LSETALPKLVAKKISQLVSDLPTSKQISILSNIVIVGGLVNYEFIQQVEKKLHLFVDHKKIPFHFHTHKFDPQNSNPV